MLKPGLYEQVINKAIKDELMEIPEACQSVKPIDEAEASKILAQYLTEIIQRGLDNMQDKGGGLSSQVALTNRIVETILQETNEEDFASLSVDKRAEQLLALLRENDPGLLIGKTAKSISRPETASLTVN